MSINPSTIEELSKMHSVENGSFLNQLLELSSLYFDSTITHSEFQNASFERTEAMKLTFGLSNAMVSKYYSSLIFILEELSETLIASEIKS